MNRRVVITGLGVVSSLGIGWQEWWENLLAGTSGISPITTFDTSDYDHHLAGVVKNFKPEKFISLRKLNSKFSGRASQLAIVAAKLALRDSKFKSVVSNKGGVCIGTTMAEIQIIEQAIKHATDQEILNLRKMKIVSYPTSNIARNIAEELRFTGRNFMNGNACASGNYALGYAYDLIKTKKLDFCVAGGVDALSRIAWTGFNRVYAMAHEKCQPFDLNRKGMMLGEGSGILFLESLEQALSRKAYIYAEILGYGLSCDASHMTRPDSNGISKAIKKALKAAGIRRHHVDYISAHGTGTIENDSAECEAMRIIFGEHLRKIPVNSIKSMLGHAMGSAAALEAVACCLSIKTGSIPPTINFEQVDLSCGIDCVPNKPRYNQRINVVLNNSQAFGGNNSCLVLRGYRAI